MCRSGNAPRPAFATADPATYTIAAASRIGSAVDLFAVNTLGTCRGPAAIKSGHRDAARASLGWKSLGWKSLGWKSLGRKSLGRTALGGKVLMKSIQTDTSDPIPL